MTKQRKRYTAAAAALTVALAGAAVGGIAAGAQTAVPTVKVTLKEFKITTASKLTTGKVTLVVTNKGKLPHALAVAGPGGKARTALIQPGKTVNLSVHLEDGATSFWCPVANHAALGMKFTAKLGSSGGGTANAGATGATGANAGGGGGSTAGAEWG